MKLIFEKTIHKLPKGRGDTYLKIYNNNEVYEVHLCDNSRNETIKEKCNKEDVWDQVQKIILLRENPYYSEDNFKIADEVKRSIYQKENKKPITSKEETPNNTSSQSPTDILKDQANEEEIENYTKGINWIDDEYYNNSWKRLKGKNISQVKESCFLISYPSSP